MAMMRPSKCMRTCMGLHTQATIRFSLCLCCLAGACPFADIDRCKTCDAIITTVRRLPLPKLPPLSLTDNVFSRSQPESEQNALNMHDAPTISRARLHQQPHMSGLQNMCR